MKKISSLSDKDIWTLINSTSESEIAAVLFDRESTSLFNAAEVQARRCRNCSPVLPELCNVCLKAMKEIIDEEK